MTVADSPTPPTFSLDAQTTQAGFGQLVGIAQSNVSDLMSRGVIAPGGTAGVWLLAYCEHLRTIAAGRDPDGQLSSERTRLAKEQADRLELRNAQDRAEFAPTVLLQAVLASAARQVAAQLDPILPDMLRRFPHLIGEPVRYLEERLAQARDAAASASLDPSQLEVDAADEGAV